MGAAGFRSIGGGTAERSSNISSRFRDGTIRRWTSTVLTWMATTLRAIFGSFHEQKISETGEAQAGCPTASSISNARSKNCVPVFDIVNAGPRNRFTVLSDSGALIVHNCGYQGGVGALMTMSKGKVPFHEMFDTLAERLPEHAEKAAEAYEQRGRGAGLSARGWQAAEIIKLAWRATNPMIASLWNDVERAAIAAIERPETVQVVGKLKFRKTGSFLFMQLPGGRCLAYPWPKLADDLTPWGKQIKKIHFMGADPVTKQWGVQDTYGGKLVENAVQAIARDLLAHAMMNLEDHGWPIVLHVHDEIVTETATDFGSTEELEKLMSEMPAWAAGCPVSAAGWSGERYRK